MYVPLAVWGIDAIALCCCGGRLGTEALNVLSQSSLQVAEEAKVGISIWELGQGLERFFELL